MCCGNDGPTVEEIVMADEPMARVFTTVEGAEVRIDRYGVATNETPALVPESVAAELEKHMAGEKAHPKAGIVGREPSSEFRIERDSDTKKKARKGQEE